MLQGPGPPGVPNVNVMYTQLLEAVLAYEADTPSLLRSQGPLADVIRLRHALERHLGRTDPGWALQAVADQLAYDAALVRLARQRGVDIGIRAFDIPERGRAAIESALLARGVNLRPRGDPVAGPSHDGTAE